MSRANLTSGHVIKVTHLDPAGVASPQTEINGYEYEKAACQQTVEFGGALVNSEYNGSSASILIVAMSGKKLKFIPLTTMIF